MTVAATISLSDAAKKIWDVLVIGAGPAGALAARELGKRGVQVLLVDRSPFPRWKVCGCCLLQPGIDVLRQLGLGDILERPAAVPLTEVRFFARGTQVSIPLTGGVVISRESLDAALVRAAIDAGVHFLPETLARLNDHHQDFREVTAQRTGDSTSIQTRIVIAADGLGGQFIAREPTIAIRIRPSSRLGAGCGFDSDRREPPPGTIEMAGGRAGYVGLVRLEDGRVNCAAALDLSAIRHGDGPGAAAASVLAEAGLTPPDGFSSALWRGTPALTRALSRHWAERLFVVGDAGGYVEPFTGEGMSLALRSARALAPLVVHAIHGWDDRIGRRWESCYSNVVKSNQSLVRAMSMLLKYPRLASFMVTLLSLCPSLATPFERRLNGVGHQ